MKQLHKSILIERPADDVFALLSDPHRYPLFSVGLSRWKPLGEQLRGVGARYRVLMRVGSIEAGGVVKITEWREGHLIAWEAESGVDQRGAWRLQTAQSGTELTYEIEFDIVGPLSSLVERIAARIIERNMLATLLAVRRMAEHDGAPAVREGDESRRD